MTRSPPPPFGHLLPAEVAGWRAVFDVTLRSQVSVTVHLTVSYFCSPSRGTRGGVLARFRRRLWRVKKGEGVFAQVPLAVILGQAPPPGFLLRKSYGGRCRRTPPGQVAEGEANDGNLWRILRGSRRASAGWTKGRRWGQRNGLCSNGAICTSMERPSRHRR